MLNSYEQRVINTLSKYKCKNIFEPLKCIPVYDPKLTIVGYLRPITQHYAITLPGCADLLARWRNENAHMAPGHFMATPESTKKWLDQQIIARADRILFLIISTDGTKIGHIGLASFDYQAKSCEIDAVVRGEKAGYGGMMTFALNSLIYWGLTELKLKQILLRVLADNERAISFYNRNSFCKVKEIPLYQIISADEEAWTSVKQNAQQVAQKCYHQMKLKVKKWKADNAILFQELGKGSGPVGG